MNNTDSGENKKKNKKAKDFFFFRMTVKSSLYLVVQKKLDIDGN